MRSRVRQLSPSRCLGLLLLSLSAASLGACSTTERGVDAFLNPVLEQDFEELPIYPDDYAFFKSLFIADLHADTLLFSRGLDGDTWGGEPIGHADIRRWKDGNVALQVLSTVSQYADGTVRTINGKDFNCHHEEDRNLIDLLMWLQEVSEETSDPIDRRQRYIEHQGQRLHSFRAGSEAVDLILTADDLMTAAETWKRDPDAPLAALLAIEGLHFYNGREATLQVLFDLGFRMASLTHHFDNRLGSSSTGCSRATTDGQGADLSGTGRQAVLEMEEMGWTLDVAHASTATLSQALGIWESAVATADRKRPPVISHTGFQGQCAYAIAQGYLDDDLKSREACRLADERNSTEGEVLKVAKAGGVIGVIYWDKQHGFKPEEETASPVLDGIVHTIERLDEALSKHHRPEGCGAATETTCLQYPGSHYIALGSDWDGSVAVPLAANAMHLLATKLRRATCRADQEGCLERNNPGKRRFSDEDVRAIAGQNVCRVLLQSLPEGKGEETAIAFCKGLRR
ncbi:MAG: membrane dipeptidase [Kiloniellales bacterium]